MVILPIDSGRYGSQDIKEIFEEQKRLDFILKFEAATASAQSKIGIIPVDAANEINVLAKSGKITLTRIKELESTTDHDMAAVVNAINEQCSPNTKPWVHFGLTSNEYFDDVENLNKMFMIFIEIGILNDKIKMIEYCKCEISVTF